MPLSDSLRPSLASRLGDLVYGCDPARRAHVQRLLRMVALAAFAALLLWIATLQGLTPAWATHVVSAYLVAGCAGLYVVIRSGLSSRWRDPSLTHAQLLFSVIAVVLAYGLIDIARGSALQLLCLLLAFQMDRLLPAQLLRTSLYAVVLIGVTLLVRLKLQPDEVQLAVEMYNLGVAAVLLPAAIVVGLEIGRLYRRQVHQREALAHTLTQLRELSTRDAMTGLVNRRQMTSLLDQEVKRQRRAGLPFSVAILDIDWFKRINDTFGHGVGDAVLTQFAQVASGALGPADTLARWGGEEFLLLMPGTSEDRALAVLRRVREAVHGHDWFAVAAGLSVTFSAGVAEHQRVQRLPQTLGQADKALYAAKHAGRDRVHRAGTPAAEGMADALADPDTAQPSPGPAPASVQMPMPMPLHAWASGMQAQASSAAGRAVWQPAVDLLLGKDPAMRQHLRLTIKAILLYALWIAMFHWYAIPTGMVSRQAGQFLIAYDLVAMLLFYPVLRSGVTAGWKDPALVLPQMMVASGACMATYVAAPDLRPSVLHLLCVIQVFGMVTLTPRGAKLGGVLAVVMLLVVTVGMGWAQPPRFDTRLDTLRLLLACFIVGSLAMLSVSYGRVRQKVRDEKQQLQQAVARVRELVVRDDLTGLFNRPHLQDLLVQEQLRCAQTGHQFCVALIDLDHFKQINDQHGHQVGDEVLIAFARTARTVLRETDVIGRWGGEEFLVLLRDTEPAFHGLRAVTRLREHLAALQLVPDVPELRVTFSCGLALGRPDEPLDHLLDRADRALYEAKHAGRDRAVLADDPAERQEARA